MRVRLGGYVHLARMLDKCRAVLAGTQGDYIYPCPLDEQLLEFAGMTSEQFSAAVQANQSDEAVVAWFQRTARPHTPAELEEWNRRLLARRPSSPESAARFKNALEAIDPTRTDITSWADLLDLEEGREVPHRDHPAPLTPSGEYLSFLHDLNRSRPGTY
ncbi:MAG: DUF5069 domain-containing protein [Nitrospira sp.]|nr:DUF5069 domain-containing protein [Nitrospira sp.]